MSFTCHSFIHDIVGIVKNHLMMFTRNLVGIPMGFGFQNDITNPTDRLLKFIVPAYIKRNYKTYSKKLHHEHIILKKNRVILLEQE